MFFVEKEPSHRSSWQVNDAISPEQNVFSEVHTIHIFKNLQQTLHHLILDIQVWYVAAGMVTDTPTLTGTHINTQTQLQ